MLGDGGANGVVALWPVVQGFEDDQQIYVAVGAGVATGMTAEEDDLFGIEAFGNQLGYRPNCGLVDRGFAHLHHALAHGFFRLPPRRLI